LATGGISLRGVLAYKIHRSKNLISGRDVEKGKGKSDKGRKVVCSKAETRYEGGAVHNPKGHSEVILLLWVVFT